MIMVNGRHDLTLAVKFECKALNTTYKYNLMMYDFKILVDGHCPVIVPALNVYLTDKLPAFVTVQDASLEVIALLRILHAFNRYWATVYEVT